MVLSCCAGSSSAPNSPNPPSHRQIAASYRRGATNRVASPCIHSTSTPASLAALSASDSMPREISIPVTRYPKKDEVKAEAIGLYLVLTNYLLSPKKHTRIIRRYSIRRRRNCHRLVELTQVNDRVESDRRTRWQSILAVSVRNAQRTQVRVRVDLQFRMVKVEVGLIDPDIQRRFERFRGAKDLTDVLLTKRAVQLAVAGQDLLQRVFVERRSNMTQVLSV